MKRSTHPVGDRNFCRLQSKHQKRKHGDEKHATSKHEFILIAVVAGTVDSGSLFHMAKADLNSNPFP